MASAPSGRYQSRLFNFVHRQTRRLTEQYARTFRHLQVSTNWSVQVLLYPVYRLFQSTELARKQLFSFVQQTWPQLQPDNSDSPPQTPPNADTPIQQVLLLVNVPSKKADTLRRTRPVVRGIATQLSSRTLVLVTAQNEILDILTTQQQQKLQEQIIGEVADYWRHQRLAYLAGQKNGEFILHPERTLTFLDRTIAELESNLAPVSEVALALGKRSREMIHLVQTQLSVLLSGFPQPAGSQSLAIAPNGSDAHTFRIQALIRAAIDYFFGSRSRNLQQTTPTHSSLKLPFISTRQKPLPHSRSIHRLGSRPSNLAKAFSRQQPPQLVSSDLDPWLTLDDLFGDSIDASTGVLEQGSREARELLSRGARERGRIEDFGRKDFPLRPPAPLPQWIETKATKIGYVKHPLEQLLEWLDRAMLLLEKVLTSVFQWVQQLWRGK